MSIATTVTTDERWARVALSHIIEGDTKDAGRVHKDGAVAVLATLPDEQAARLRDLNKVGADLSRHSIRVIIPGDDEWPTRLNDLAVPPLCLYAQGAANVAAVTSSSVSVIGSRAATLYGTGVAGTVSGELVRRGVTVVSGAAFGIDAAAHRGALDFDGPTVAVIARGLDRAYPQAHAGLIHDITNRGGVVVSELPPGLAPYRMRFLARNRIIAALSQATVVVEAGIRSGSLNAAKSARALGRPVGAFPGDVNSVQSDGCHKLIRSGDAHLVSYTSDVLDLIA